MTVSQDSHAFIVFGAGVPSLTYEAVGPTGWSFKCISARASTSAHLAKVVLAVSN